MDSQALLEKNVLTDAFRSRRLAYGVLVFAGYFVGGRIGLAIPFTSNNVSPVWPPAGLALAAILLLGYRVWPAITAAAFLVNFFSPLPHVAAFGIAFGNTAGPLLAAWLLRRIPGFRPGLTRLQDALALLGLASLVGPAISAAVGTWSLSLAHVSAWSSASTALLVWWLGDAMGVLIVAPLVLTMRALVTSLDRGRWLELAALLFGAIVCSAAVFGRPPDHGAGRDMLSLTLFPLVMWAAVRFDGGGAATITAVIAAIAVWDTARGLGLFVGGTTLQNATLLQAFLSVMAVSGVSVSALVAERTRLIRERAEREEQRHRAEGKQSRDAINLLSRAVEQTADTVIVTDKRGVIEFVNPAFETTTGYAWEEAVGRTPAILKSGRHDREFYRALWDEILTGRPFRGTLINRKKQGDLYWAEQSITPVRDDDGQITHFVSVLKDVTELRWKQEQEVQLRLAREVQQQFCRPPATLPGLQLAAASSPMRETGGDYFDFIAIGPDSAYVAVGDASGNGLGAALVMALARAYVRSFASLDLSAGDILTRVNQLLAADLEENRFVTMLLARIDARTRALSYASAGHVPGFHFHGNDVQPMASTGPPLGIFAESTFPDCDVPLTPDDLVVLVTDGVLDSGVEQGTEFGKERLIQHVAAHRDQPANEIAHLVCEAARVFGGPGPQADDITSLVVRVLPE